MNQIRTIIIIIIIAIFTSLAASEEIYFRFNYESRNQMDKLTHIVSLDDIKENMVYAYANEEEFSQFKSLDIAYEILTHPGTLYQPLMTSSTRELREWDTYPTYETYVDIMYEFAEDYPELCTVESIGTTVDGRELLIAKISDNVNEHEAEPEFFYTGTMHGDETTGYVLLLRLIDYFLTNYGSDNRITNMVDNIEIWINPNANPDGTYNGGNDTVFGAQRYNGNNIDLNRNFPDPEDGQHPDNNAWQPETIAMMDFASQHHFVMSANFHGGTEVINYPWDTWPTHHADDIWFQYVSHLYADSAQENGPADYFDGYNDGITNGYEWYTTSGSRQDYMNYFQNCREVTIEISDVKLVPESQLEPHWNYNKDAMLFYMEQVMYGFGGLITDANSNPVMAELTVDSHDNNNAEIKTNPVVGNYHRPIEPGTWEITVSAYGYQEQTINDINTSNNNLTELDIQMVADPSTIEVTGEILNAQTNEPIANANIEILNKDIAPRVTNADGLAQFYIYAETIDFRVTAPGYEATEETITISSSNDNFTMFINMGPHLTADQETLEFDIYAGETASQSITVTNTGGGTLNFVAITQEHDTRNVSDAYVRCQATSFTPGEDYDWIFTINNQSSDGEWIKGLDIDFPEGVIVTNADDFIGGSGGSMVYDETTGNGPIINWFGETTLGYGVLHDGQFANTTVNVTIESTVSQNIQMDYTIYGDGYGEDPHTASGTMEVIYPFGWMQIDPLSGSLNSGESINLNVGIDSQGMEVGDYYIDLLLTDHDFNNVLIPICLSLEQTGTEETTITDRITLSANYPNPFNPETRIDFSVIDPEAITHLTIFNGKGQKVVALVNQQLPTGNHNVIWNGKNQIGKNMPSGIYFYRLESGNNRETRKMILLK